MTSPLYSLVKYSFIVQTIQPGKIPTERLVSFLQVAKVLHPQKLFKLLLEIFSRHRSSLDSSSLEYDEEGCALLLSTSRFVNLILRNY